MSSPDAVNDRLFFARQRLTELERLNNGDLAGAQPRDRQQLIQEFFFHLVGAVEFLTQVVNTSKNLLINPEEVNVRDVCKKLPNGSRIRRLLEQLHPITRGKPLPLDPYSEEGCHFRILVFRNRVCHQGHNPFFFRVGSIPRSSLFIDPRNGNLGGSQKPAIDELWHFWKLVNDKCQQVLTDCKMLSL